MGTLGDELRKANLVSRKQMKKASHDERVRRKELGTDGLRREEDRKERERQAKAAEKKEKDRRLEAERQARQARTQADRDAERRLEELIGRESLKRIAGPRRFHFVDRNNRIPYVSVSDDAGDRLARGELAIVEIRSGSGTDIHLVKRKAASEISELDPEAVRFLN